MARKLQPGDPSTEEILAAIGALAAGSEQRMQDYHRMFQQEATHAYKEKYESELVCKHDTLSIRAPGQTFHALQVPKKIHKIDLTALRKIILLAASTLDLEVIRGHEDVGKNKRKALDGLVADSDAALKHLEADGVWVEAS